MNFHKNFQEFSQKELDPLIFLELKSMRKSFPNIYYIKETQFFKQLELNLGVAWAFCGIVNIKLTPASLQIYFNDLRPSTLD